MVEQLSFEMAKPVSTGFPQEPIIRSAEIEGNYRWVLKRAWGAGPCILWCGLNPSTADGQRDDPTMRREIGFSYRWGFGSLIKVNVYPFISANQPALHKWRKARIKATPRSPEWDSVLKSVYNLETVSEQLKTCQKHVAAWGNGVDHDDLEEFLEDGFGIVPIPVDWYCLGKNADGSPIHPMARGRHRISDDTKLQLWRSHE